MRDLERAFGSREMQELLGKVPGGRYALKKNPRAAIRELVAHIDRLEANQRKPRGRKKTDTEDGRDDQDVPV